MKKKSLFKGILILFLVYMLLTWFIPTGYFNNGQYVKDAIEPIGLFDIIRIPIITFTSSVFVWIGLVILLIGGFYGVLNKTGVYQKLVEGIAKKFNKKETTFLVITTLLFVILSSLTALGLPLFIMVPMFATILLLLGYSKFTSMLATVGSILIGNLVSTYGYSVAGYIFTLTNDINNSIIYRIVLFIVITGLLLFTVIKSGEKKVKNKDEIILYNKLDTKNKTKKSCIPMVVISIIMIFIILIGMINWSGLFNISLFTDIYTKITSIKVSGYSIFNNVIGSIYPMGKWSNYELAFMLLITTMIIGLVYKLSLKDFIESFKDGIKTMIPVALYAVLANILFLSTIVPNTDYTIFPTIANWLFELTKGFNAITFGFVSFIGSLIYNDCQYLLSSISSPLAINYKDSLPVVCVVFQSIHGLVQLIAPTSVLLVAGLKYFDIDYKEWLKKTYKFLLAILLVIIIITIIMNLV